MTIWRKLFTLGRAGAHDAAAGVVDANAIKILDQEIRDADTAQGKARDDMAGLVARRRILEKEVASFREQAIKYENSARAAVGKGDMDLARQVAQRIADLEQQVSVKEPQIADMRAAEEQLHTAIAATDRRIETLRREVEVVKVNESVQRAQASVAARGAGAGSSLGSAADSLARIKERQAVRGERIKAAGELEDMRTGADLDEKLRLAGIGPGQSSADDILARLSAPAPVLQIEQKSAAKTGDDQG
ncbi:MAG: PspA/IM30 family protein [Phenylobacterium sp.]|uniref:PspA/IM30 family protein n=1 Tax=Phenylobacterium sp. TaxID=1871053 RepID=UPI002724290B|nr:PspA/IM30 family protein [Phenylobacterium sp.]MDO8913925.1 PspA/IM30 family protein [Phenylobacterium sp.]MDP3100392.1 PspA/IM30 family protein [Phenylobacterium sp.]MDP3635109.1 PspA/IM30 family protein [Phenylobacterium sp.]MDP3866753.1 PspA/IM30 family protein [Phenylobacterium sp.]